MGRIFARKHADKGTESGVKKITLRKNSMKRKIASDKVINRIAAKATGKSKPRRLGGALPPRPAGGLPPKAQKKEDELPTEDKNEKTQKKQKLQPFSLVIIKKKKADDKAKGDEEEATAAKQYKVKMPLKMIAKGVAKAQIEDDTTLEFAPPPDSGNNPV